MSLTIPFSVRTLVAFTVVCFTQAVLPVAAQQPFSIPENYTKFEYRIPMRDGAKLFTAVYAPKDTAKRYPFLIQRTPYSVAPYGADKFRQALGPDESFAKEGYIFVYQDVRGRYLSE